MPPDLSPPERDFAERLTRHGVPSEIAQSFAPYALAVDWNDMFVTSTELEELTGLARSTIESRTTKYTTPPEARPQLHKPGRGGMRAKPMWLVDFALPAILSLGRHTG
jgi:hypothetical protein